MALKLKTLMTLIKIFGPILLLVSVFLWGDHKGYTRAEHKWQAAYTKLQEEVKLETAKAELKDEKNARTTEQLATKITEDKSNEYQTTVADLRARYDRLLASTRANKSSSTESSVPGLSNSSSGSDGSSSETRLPPKDALICSVQAEQLYSLQQWVKEQKELYDHQNQER